MKGCCSVIHYDQAPQCEFIHAHPELVQRIQQTLPDEGVLCDLAELFKIFGDSTRIKILYALHDNELCVQDIANAVQLSQSAVSHQLRVLKDTKLVRFRRDGKTVYYALDDDHVRSILSIRNRPRKATGVPSHTQLPFSSGA